MVTGVLVALFSAAAIPAAGDLQWQPRMSAAKQYAEQRAGSVSFAVVNPNGRVWRYRSRTSVVTVSVIKVMFLAAYLRQSDVRRRDLRDSDRDLLRPMIKRSDNYSASLVANDVGAGAVNRLADRAGMRDFSYTRPWGSSRTSARDQARFMFRLRQYIPDRHETFALRLLARIVDSQRWGIGRVDTPGWRKHFKGGWGSGSGYADHQVVRLRHKGGGGRIGIAVMTTGSPSHAYATRTLRGVFGRLLADLPN